MFTSPVFVAEMLVSSRRARYFALRVVLGLILLVVLYQNVRINEQFNAAGANNLSNAANTFFQSFAVFELLAIAMLGPALSAGAIAVERERRTLEYLLVTDLSDWEIIFGKTCAAVARIVTFLLAGVPVLALATCFGGIDPLRVLAVSTIALCTTIYITSVAILISVSSPRAADAVMRTYFLLFVLLTVPPIASVILDQVGGSFWGGETINTVIDYVFEMGNPFSVLTYLFSWSALGDSYWEPIRNMVLNQMIVAALCLSVVRWWLRPLHLRDSSRAKAAHRSFRSVDSAPVYERYPMLWKELRSARSSRLAASGRAQQIVLALVFGTSMLCLLYEAIWQPVPFREFSGIIPAICILLSCAGLLMVVGRTAVAICGERERDTWIMLLSTPLEGIEIVGAKLIGGLYSARWLAICLPALWVFGIWADARLALSVPISIGTLAVLLVFAAALGLACSLRFATTMRSLGAALSVSFLLGGGYLFCGSCCLFFIMPTGETFVFSWVVPYLLGLPYYAIAAIENDVDALDFVTRAVFPYALGMVSYTIAAFALWSYTVANFDRRAGRSVVAWKLPSVLLPPRATTVPAEVPLIVEEIVD